MDYNTTMYSVRYYRFMSEQVGLLGGRVALT
jgi:hypothetical protein